MIHNMIIKEFYLYGEKLIKLTEASKDIYKPQRI